MHSTVEKSLSLFHLITSYPGTSGFRILELLSHHSSFAVFPIPAEGRMNTQKGPIFMLLDLLYAIPVCLAVLIVIGMILDHGELVHRINI